MTNDLMVYIKNGSPSENQELFSHLDPLTKQVHEKNFYYRMIAACDDSCIKSAKADRFQFSNFNLFRSLYNAIDKEFSRPKYAELSDFLMPHEPEVELVAKFRLQESLITAFATANSIKATSGLWPTSIVLPKLLENPLPVLHSPSTSHPANTVSTYDYLSNTPIQFKRLSNGFCIYGLFPNSPYPCTPTPQFSGDKTAMAIAVEDEKVSFYNLFSSDKLVNTKNM